MLIAVPASLRSNPNILSADITLAEFFNDSFIDLFSSDLESNNLELVNSELNNSDSGDSTSDELLIK